MLEAFLPALESVTQNSGNWGWKVPKEAAESVTPPYGLVMAAEDIWSVLKKSTKVTERVALRAKANKETG